MHGSNKLRRLVDSCFSERVNMRNVTAWYQDLSCFARYSTMTSQCWVECLGCGSLAWRQVHKFGFVKPQCCGSATAVTLNPIAMFPRPRRAADLHPHTVVLRTFPARHESGERRLLGLVRFFVRLCSVFNDSTDRHKFIFRTDQRKNALFLINSQQDTQNQNTCQKCHLP